MQRGIAAVPRLPMCCRQVSRSCSGDARTPFACCAAFVLQRSLLVTRARTVHAGLPLLPSVLLPGNMTAERSSALALPRSVAADRHLCACLGTCRRVRHPAVQPLQGCPELRDPPGARVVWGLGRAQVALAGPEVRALLFPAGLRPKPPPRWPLPRAATDLCTPAPSRQHFASAGVHVPPWTEPPFTRGKAALLRHGAQPALGYVALPARLRAGQHMPIGEEPVACWPRMRGTCPHTRQVERADQL